MYSPEYYAKLSPSYCKALTKVEFQLKDPRSRQNDISDFMKTFMIPQKLWDFITTKDKYSWGCRSDWFAPAAARFFFCQDRHLSNRCNKYYDYEYMSTTVDLRHLSFPCKDLERRMKHYEKEVYSFIPLHVYQRYEKMKALYSKIKKAEGNLDEWFAALVDSDDVQFVCDSVEYRLGTDLTYKNLWKKYIDFLKKHDFELLLETYSKCVRFFTDDKDIMNGYREAADQYGRHIPVPWKNLFSFEVFDGDFWWNKSNDFEQPPNVSPVTRRLTVRFIAKNPAKPDFPFRSPTINFILKYANGAVLQKCFKTCKWFYATRPITVCYKFHEVNSPRKQPIEIKKQSIMFFKNSVLHSNLDKLFVSTVFTVGNKNPNFLSNLIPKMYRCTAKYVKIWNQNLSLKDLQFLIGHAVNLHITNVKNSDKKEFSLADILHSTPKLKELQLDTIACSTDTSEKLCELQLENKLQSFMIGNIKNNLLEPKNFSEFIKNNFSANAYITIQFEVTNKKYIYRFRQILGDAVTEKWAEDEKPKFDVR